MPLSRCSPVALVAALSAVATAAPLSPANAATAPSAVAPLALEAAGWGGFPAVLLPIDGPLVGQEAAITGAVIITTAPTTFINTNNQVSAGDNASGGQLGP